jgi:hypothetical protein
MGLSPKVKQTLHYINPFKPPKEAEEAGHADFRPVSGWRRESNVSSDIETLLMRFSFVQDGARTSNRLDQRGYRAYPYT